MAAKQYVALLRGINVGGKNKVPMADLRDAVEADGHTRVRTYIQSGNVLFESTASAAELEDRIERALECHLGLPLVVVVRSERQLRAVVDNAPKGFGAEPTTYHSDVLFLKAPLTPKQAMGVVSLRDGVDQVWPGTRVLYFARLSARRVQSKMGRIVSTPEYKQMTIRSWKTTTKLVELLDE
jgi:uncharacterized protein (DUF1697 family)